MAEPVSPTGLCPADGERRAERPAGLCLPPTRWQSPSAQGPGLCPPGRGSCLPSKLPPAFRAEAIHTGCCAPPPPGVKTRFQTSLPAVGQAAPWASRATSRQRVLCQGLCQPDLRGPAPPRQLSHKGTPPPPRLVLCSVPCQPDPALPPGLAAGSCLPGPRPQASVSRSHCHHPARHSACATSARPVP